MSFKTQAQKLYDKGFSIMPIKKGEKKPMLAWEKYQKQRVTQEELNHWKELYAECNIAIITGQLSNLLVLDIDGPEGQKSIHGRVFPLTLSAKTGRGKHCYFKMPAKTIGNFVGILTKVDIRGEGGYVVAPDSIHPSGDKYEWIVEEDVCEPPLWLIELTKKASIPKRKSKAAVTEIDKIRQGAATGTRNDSCAKLAGYFIAKGYPDDDILDLLRAWNLKNKPPLGEKEIQATLDSIIKKNLSNQEPPIDAKNTDLKTAKAVISKWLYHKDDNIIDVILATVASTHHSGDPLWIMIIGAPSSGKTEILRGFDRHQDCYFIDRISKATFVTGFTKAKGILERMGSDPKTFIIQDFSTILSKPPYDRMEIMDTLRQMYNGSYHNEWGNGKKFTWKGKVAVISGCTPDIEASNHSMAELGERFMYYRVESDDDDTRKKMMKKARLMEGLETQARKEMAEALHGVINSVRDIDFNSIKIDDVYADWLEDLVDLTTSMRTPVKRNQFRREIVEYKPHKEGPGRMFKACKVLLKSLALIRGRTQVNDSDYGVAVKICADSIQSVRREALKGLLSVYGKGGVRAKDIAQITGYQSTESVGYHLADLAALGIVNRWVDKTKIMYNNSPFLYELDKKIADKLDDCGLKDII